MPVSVVAAVAGAGVSSVVGGMVGAGILGSIAGAVAGGLTSAVVNAAFADKPDTQNPQAALDQEAHGRLITVRQAVAPWQWIYGQVRVGGILTFIEVSSDNQYLHMVITLAGHECEEIGDIWFEDETVPLDGSGNATGRYAGFVRILKSEGDEAAGVQPFSDLVSESASLWTSAHCQTGRAKIYVRLKWSEDLFPQGIPNITAVMKGRKVYDPRTSPSTTAWSANAALCINDYLTNTDAGLGCVYASEINETQLIAAANTCDENVNLAAGGTEDRYTCNGVFAVNGAPREILGRLLTSLAGSARFLGGTWGVYPAVYATPTITLTQDDLRGALHVMPRLSRRDLANAVKGIYVSPANNWQAADFPAVTNATYLAEDQGERIWRELDLPYTTSGATAQRIAKLELERVRQQIGVEWPGKLGCYRLQPGDTVMITLTRYGWSAKVFEVVSTQLVHEEQGDGGIVLGCDLTLRETASTIYDWTAADDETTVDAAPDTNLPDPFTVAVPGNPAVAEALYETREGRGVAVKATVTWTASTDVHVRGYVPEYRVNGASTWLPFPEQTGTTLEIFDIAPGRYDFRVKAKNQLGVGSSYATSSNVEIYGLGTRPAAIAGLTIQKLGGIAVLRWQQAAELDVLRGGRILFRHSEDVASPTWEASFSIGDPQGVGGDQVFALVPLKEGTYLAKAEDSSGNQSSSAATVRSDGAMWLTFSTVGSVQEDSTFSGTKSNVMLDGVTLKLTGAGMFDDIADFDSISSLDDYGGVNTSGTYTFSAGLDLTTKQRVRLVSTIVGQTVDVNDKIDERSANIDDWLDFDGTAGGGSTDCYLEVRATDDNPAGSPTWSAWNRLDASEQYARAFQFRAQLTSTDVAFNQCVTQLRVTAQQVT